MNSCKTKFYNLYTMNNFAKDIMIKKYRIQMSIVDIYKLFFIIIKVTKMYFFYFKCKNYQIVIYIVISYLYQPFLHNKQIITINYIIMLYMKDLKKKHNKKIIQQNRKFRIFKQKIFIKYANILTKSIN